MESSAVSAGAASPEPAVPIAEKGAAPPESGIKPALSRKARKKSAPHTMTHHGPLITAADIEKLESEILVDATQKLCGGEEEFLRDQPLDLVYL